MSRVFNLAKFPYLAANIYNKSTSEFWDFPQTTKTTVFNIGDLKVGIIGLGTKESVYTSTLKLEELDFKEYIPIVVEESRKMRENQIDIIILVAHWSFMHRRPSRFG